MMSHLVIAGVIALLGVAEGLLPSDPIIKYDSEIRYGLMPGPDGKVYPVDMWLTVEGLKEVARFNPLAQNQYHLFTRENPTVSQPILHQNDLILNNSNFNPLRRTVVLLHGWLGSATTDSNTVLVPEFLRADDVNVIVVDWSAGASTVNYAAAVANTVTSGLAVADVLNWINRVTSASAGSYHICGFSLGGHKAGIVGRNIAGFVAYITALDPAFPGWITHEQKLFFGDSQHTEVIHTNAGIAGYLASLGHVDFYPNGGINMPGCGTFSGCSHDRSFHYFAESLRTGGFTGRRCASYVTATTGNCILPGTLQMGGLMPKTGSRGIYYLETNDAPPFSRG